MASSEHLAPRTLPNAKSPWRTEEGERECAADAHMQVLRSLLPGMIARLGRITDPRRRKTVGHPLTTVLLWGILMFVVQFHSRREGNRELSRPLLRRARRAVFPEWAIEDMPPSDTVNRVLARIEPEALEAVHVGQIRSLLRNRRWREFMVGGRYGIAIDGMHKHQRTFPWAPEALRWKHGSEMHYTVYVLEAVLVSPQGVTLPIMAEFCANEAHAGDTPEEAEARKQDCEQKGFHRLTARLKKAFPRLNITIVADGLYANGPSVAQCRRHHWDFMITLKDGSPAAVWHEAQSLRTLDRSQGRSNTWGDRRQPIWWANDIDYRYGPGDARHERLHVVVCEEQWTERDKQGKEVECHARYAWLSGERLTPATVAVRCNRVGRHRWDIEEHILAIKRHTRLPGTGTPCVARTI